MSLKKTWLSAILLVLVFVFVKCDEDEAGLPEVITLASNNITAFSAEVIGSIAKNGGATITESGMCWSTSASPTVENDKTTDGTANGPYTSKLDNLTPGTNYFVRAYASNSVGIAYGNEITLTTLITAPTVATTQVSEITQVSATSGGNAITDGGATVTAVGVCWSTQSNPTVEFGNKTSNGSGTGNFTSNLTGLTPGTTYFVRAYATTSIGTAYGAEVSFSTLDRVFTAPTVATTQVSEITQVSATSGGNSITDGGATVTVAGVCWSTQSNPTVESGNKTSNGYGTENFTSNLTGLTPGTTYFVRAYATTSIGTAYGAEISFSTLNPVITAPVTDIDGNEYGMVAIGTQTWMNENLKTTRYNDGSVIPEVTSNATWAGLTSGAYCFYNNVPAYDDVYGKLYNFQAVVDPRKLCPVGTHAPSLAEWETLIFFLGGNYEAGNKLKEAGTEHWSSGNGGTNDYLFTALSASVRDYDGGFSSPLGAEAYFYTASTNVSFNNLRYSVPLSALNGYAFPFISTPGEMGMSVRCLAD